MRALVLYDSAYGNTRKVAEAMGLALDCKVVRVTDADIEGLGKYDLLIVGSPVHGGRATFSTEQLLKKIPAGSLKSVKVAAFDTRFASTEQALGIRILMSIIRYAAERIAKDLKKKGGMLIVKPEGFIVEDKEGPLKKGELKRAAEWASKIQRLLSK